ncbi:MAG TPA: hypothetical protein VMY42_17170 [Thermoguttaceae bacterium]|nr:hypothetical protein [Thermoguttaceae bacterium]
MTSDLENLGFESVRLNPTCHSPYGEGYLPLGHFETVLASGYFDVIRLAEWKSWPDSSKTPSDVPRVMLGTNVTVEVVDGNLIIAGDNADNWISVRRTIIDGQYVVRGQSPSLTEPTCINGKVEPVFVSGVTGDVRINLGGGDDRVTVFGGMADGESPPNLDEIPLLVLPNNLIITGTSGEKHVELVYLDVGGFVDVTTGSGSGHVRVHGVEIATDLVIRTGDGNDWVGLLKTNVHGRTEIETYAGEDQLEIVKSTVQIDSPIEPVYADPSLAAIPSWYEIGALESLDNLLRTRSEPDDDARADTHRLLLMLDII